MALNLYYNFAEDKSLTARVGPNLSISRASTASYRGSSGHIQTAAANTARFDHDVDGASLGLLIEPQRTNICLQSENLQVSWTANRSSVTANATLAPDNTLTADKITDDGATGVNTVNVFAANTLATSTAYVFSAFVKADQLDWTTLQIANLGALSITQYYDLTNGVVGTPSADVTASGIDKYSNGWYRCWLTFTSDGVDTSCNPVIGVAEADGDQIVDRDGTSSIFAWGAQLEAGSVITSYIPTTTTSVTRNVDVVTSSDVSWFSATKGTFYTAASQPLPVAETNYLFQVDDGSTSNRVFHFISGADAAGYQVVDGSVTQASFTGGTPYDDSPNVLVRQVTCYEANDFENYYNGTRDGTGDQSGTLPSGITTLRVGHRSGVVSPHHGHIQELAYWDERFPNEDLEAYSNGDISISGVIDRMRRLKKRRQMHAILGGRETWGGRFV